MYNLLFRKMHFWERVDGRCYDDPGGDTGGDTGGSAVIDTPDMSSSGASDAGAAHSEAGNAGGDTGGAGDQGGESHVLDSAPAERGTDQYKEWYNDLSQEDKTNVEQDIFNGYKPPENNEGDTGTGDTADGSGDGDGKSGSSGDTNADPNDVGEWTPEEFSALDEPSQGRIKAMQGVIDKFTPYMDGSLDEGLRIIEEDPVIKARMAEIKGEGEYALPDSLSQKFDVNNYISDEDKANFQLLDDKGKESFSKSITKAFEDGAKQGGMSEQYNSKQSLLKEQRIHTFTRQLNDIVGDSPSMKVPTDSKGNAVAFNNSDHPLNEYLKWANTNMSDDLIAQIGHKASHAAFLSATGKQDQAMENVAKNVRTSFLQNMDNLDKSVATSAGRQSQTPAGDGTKVYNGIDLTKYKSDEVYARQVFDHADQPTRIKLEQFKYDGRVPT